MQQMLTISKARTIKGAMIKGAMMRVVVTTAGSFLILLPLLFLLNLGASANPGNPSDAPAAAPLATAAGDCASASTVPDDECLALVELFTATNGTGWISNTHWLQFGSNAPCGWYGVLCDGGHVTGLRLNSNQLSGTLPLSLGNLTALERLRLENNALQGRVPPTICNLTALTVLSLDYNALYTRRSSVEDCVAPLDSDWRASQTVAVDDLHFGEILTETLHLAWTPISYTEGGGYYEIGVATQPEGPFQLHGTTPNKVAASYVVTGLEPGATYFIRVRTVTPPHGDQPSPVRSEGAQIAGATRALAGRVLVAAYFPADNDLATEIPYVIERMRRGTAVNPNVQVVLFVDGRQEGDTQVLEIAEGVVKFTDVVIDQWGNNELDSADPEVLAWFLQYARGKFPAERSVAAIIGHGVALAPEVEWPDAPTAQVANSARPLSRPSSGAIPPLPKEHDYSPSDVTNRGYMSVVDMGVALMAATDNGNNPFDVVFFDQCFQGSLDMLYEVRNSTRVFVASPNYAWLVAAYDRYLVRFTPGESPVNMATAIINHYEAALNPHHPNAIFWIRNGDLLDIAAQVSVLADALLEATQAGETSKIVQAAQQSKYVDTTQCGRQNLQLGPPDELIGLESLMMGLEQSFGTGDAYGIAAAVDGLEPLLANLAKRKIAGNPYIAPEEHWDFGNSLTVLAPLPRDTRSSVAWRASIYRSDVPFSAAWTVDPSQPLSVTASLAYVRDGRWDEFLAEWYLNLSPTVGQWCQYIPPAQVAISETETLTLAASDVTTDGLRLTWTPVDDSSAVEYWLYLQDPYAIGWQGNRAIALAETSAAFSALDRGDYRYLVVARNDEQVTIAQSNEVTVTITGGSVEEPLVSLLLPLVTSK